MNFDFTDDQNALRDAVARWVDKSFPFERRHGIAKAGGKTREVWRELADLGLCGLAIAPEHGGMGLGAVDAMVVMEELGRGLVNAPYAAAALMAPALLQAQPHEAAAPWLERMADGRALVVPALQEAGARYRIDAPRATFTDGRLNAFKQLVPAGDEADAFLVPVQGAQGHVALVLVERAHAQVRAYPTQDGARAADLRFTDAPATLVSDDALPALERALDVAVAAACAEGVGAMEALVALTVEYMHARKQFGVPIASFQALRHRIADVKMALELARSMSYFAHLKLGEPPTARRYAMAQAKVQLGQSMRLVGQQCVQLHGGIGVTDEYAGSHYFKRLTMLELAHGDTLHHLADASARMGDNAGVFA